MTTHVPRAPYTPNELERLYHPDRLELRQVQVVLRHGERTPVGPRFQNAGLAAYWPYCHVARSMTTSVMNTADWSKWDATSFARQIETQGQDDFPVIAKGPRGEADNICLPGELTDKGRQTTLALGQRLRHLYVDQLNFMPSTLSSLSSIYFRATPIPRAQESVHQAFTGFYPPDHRATGLPRPTIILRAPADETLFPNEGACRRFSQLARAFAQRAADTFNDSPEMAHINKTIGKWMPADSPKIAVDSHPRLSGIMDTMNATLAHGSETRLPQEFYDPKTVHNIDKIAVREWFDGYKESREYRTLGIGGLVADITARMVMHAESNSSKAPGQHATAVPQLGLSGAHDTTIAGVLASLGAFENEAWPPFTSHVAVELFRRADYTPRTAVQPILPSTSSSSPAPASGKSWWSSVPLLSSMLADFTPPSLKATREGTPATLARRRFAEMQPEERAVLDEHYVRVRYNDRPVTIPACRLPGNHLEGDQSFCTLAAFKQVVDDFAPRDWKAQCRQNLFASAFPAVREPAGEIPASGA